MELLRKPAFIKDYQKFNDYKDKIFTENDFRHVKHKCIVCGELGHFKSQCYRETPEMEFLQFSQYSMISKLLFKKTFKRRKKFRFSAMRSI